MLDPVYAREAVEMFELARRLLTENGVDRLDIERRLWIKRQHNTHTHNVVVFWRPAGFSEIVLVVRDNGPAAPSVIRYAPGPWRRILRNAAADFDAFKNESA